MLNQNMIQRGTQSTGLGVMKPNYFGLKYSNKKTQRKGRMDKQHDKRIRRTRRRLKSTSIYSRRH